MRKILIFAVFIFGLAFAQFSQAQSYTPQEGDKAIVYEHTCGWCFKTYYEKSFYRNKQLIAKDEAPPRYGCSNSQNNGEHYWPNSYFASYYIFTNGNWQRVTDY